MYTSSGSELSGFTGGLVLIITSCSAQGKRIAKHCGIIHANGIIEKCRTYFKYFRYYTKGKLKESMTIILDNFLRHLMPLLGFTNLR